MLQNCDGTPGFSTTSRGLSSRHGGGREASGARQPLLVGAPHLI